jgi:hypothetical protein
MSVFKRGLKLSKGAALEELEFSDSDSSDGDVSEDKSEQHSGQEDESEDDGSSEDRNEKISGTQSKSRTKRRQPEKTDDEDHDEEENEEGSDEDTEADPSNIEYPVTCSLCNKLLFNLASVNEHVASKSHLKKEAIVAKKSRESLPPEKVQKLKAKNERKRQRRLEKKRMAQVHVWGEHVKPEKHNVTNNAEVGSENGRKKHVKDERPSQPAGKSGKKHEQPDRAKNVEPKFSAPKSSAPKPSAAKPAAKTPKSSSNANDTGRPTSAGSAEKKRAVLAKGPPPNKRQRSAAVSVD